MSVDELIPPESVTNPTCILCVRGVNRTHREILELKEAHRETHAEVKELKGIVLNGLRADVGEIKEIVTKVKTVWGFLMLSAKVSAGVVGAGISLTALALGIIQIVERV